MIGTKPSLGCRLSSFRYGDHHALGFQIEGRKTIALISMPSLVSFLCVSRLRDKCQCLVKKWHFLSRFFLPGFWVYFSPNTHYLLDFSEGTKKILRIRMRYVVPSALAIMAEIDFLFDWLHFQMLLYIDQHIAPPGR